MELKRFFINPNQIRNGLAVIGGEEYVHIVKVTRHKVGYRLILCTGDGQDVTAEITAISKDEVTAKVLSVEKNVSEWSRELTLFQSVTKGEKLDVIVQKAVELGVTSIIPFYSQYSQTEINLPRLNKIAQEACKQCGRAVCVTVHAPIKLSELPLNAYDRVFFPYENETEVSFCQLPSSVFTAEKAALIVGSEGGFSEKEAQLIKGQGAVCFSLGRRILRAETAVIVSITLLADRLGELAL